MADDVNPALRAELDAAIAVIDPQIRGLHDIAVVSITTNLLIEVNKEISDRERRRVLLQNAINCLNAANEAMTALEHDGYPELPPEQLSSTNYAELQGQSSDFDAAIGVFVPEAKAATVSIGLGNPEDKPGE